MPAKTIIPFSRSTVVRHFVSVAIEDCNLSIEDFCNSSNLKAVLHRLIENTVIPIIGVYSTSRNLKCRLDAMMQMAVILLCSTRAMTSLPLYTTVGNIFLSQNESENQLMIQQGLVQDILTQVVLAESVSTNNDGSGDGSPSDAARVSLVIKLIANKAASWIPLAVTLAEYLPVCLRSFSKYILCVNSIGQDIKEAIDYVAQQQVDRLHQLMEDQEDAAFKYRRTERTSINPLNEDEENPLFFVNEEKFQFLRAPILHYFGWLRVNEVKLVKECRISEVIEFVPPKIRAWLKGEDYLSIAHLISVYQDKYKEHLTRMPLPLQPFSSSDVNQATKDVSRECFLVNKVPVAGQELENDILCQLQRLLHILPLEEDATTDAASSDDDSVDGDHAALSVAVTPDNKMNPCNEKVSTGCSCSPTAKDSPQKRRSSSYSDAEDARSPTVISSWRRTSSFDDNLFMVLLDKVNVDANTVGTTKLTGFRSAAEVNPIALSSPITKMDEKLANGDNCSSMLEFDAGETLSAVRVSGTAKNRNMSKRDVITVNTKMQAASQRKDDAHKTSCRTNRCTSACDLTAQLPAPAAVVTTEFDRSLLINQLMSYILMAVSRTFSIGDALFILDDLYGGEDMIFVPCTAKPSNTNTNQLTTISMSSNGVKVTVKESYYLHQRSSLERSGSDEQSKPLVKFDLESITLIVYDSSQSSQPSSSTSSPVKSSNHPSTTNSIDVAIPVLPLNNLQINSLYSKLCNTPEKVCHRSITIVPRSIKI